ncbi:MAG: hypothetical protein KIT56_05760 [Gammaproteobacteria bacterium]|nr:hypothetical protein [Gammaproteobacteria bacterium]MCW5583374.1 hypothetical protein [Gammaproteobacteria bacterium]
MADKTKSNKDPIKAAIDSNPCGSCRAMGLPSCKGHGGSGGGSDSNESKKEEADYKVIGAPSPTTLASTVEQDKAKVMWVQSQLLSNVTNNYEVGLLLIESDRLRGNLTFKVRPRLSKVEEEISRQFLQTIKTEFEEFKNQLAEKGVSTTNFSATLKDNELSVKIPNPKYYDAFIKHLENKNLLPVPNPEREAKKAMLSSARDNKKQAFNPTPLSTRLEKK